MRREQKQKNRARLIASVRKPRGRRTICTLLCAKSSTGYCASQRIAVDELIDVKKKK